jgi:hypothetical protein
MPICASSGGAGLVSLTPLRFITSWSDRGGLSRPVFACTSVGQPPRHASAEPEAWHVACFLLRLVCRVLIPPPEGRGGAELKTRGGMRLPLVAACAWRRVFWAAPGYVVPLARYAIRAHSNSLLGFLCERCEIGQRSLIRFFHSLLSRFPCHGKAAHRR